MHFMSIHEVFPLIFKEGDYGLLNLLVKRCKVQEILIISEDLCHNVAIAIPYS